MINTQRKNKLLIGLLFVSTLFMGGCDRIKKLEIFSTVVEHPLIIPPMPREMNFNKVEFLAVSLENDEDAEQLYDFLKKEQSDSGVVFYLITVKTYENLGLNLSETVRYIENQGDMIQFFIDYHRDKNNKEKEDGRKTKKTIE
jgi:hypothetical protein